MARQPIKPVRSTMPPSLYRTEPTRTGAKTYGMAQDAATAAGNGPFVKTRAEPSGSITPTPNGIGRSSIRGGSHSESWSMTASIVNNPRQKAQCSFIMESGVCPERRSANRAPLQPAAHSDPTSAPEEVPQIPVTRSPRSSTAHSTPACRAKARKPLLRTRS